MSSEMTMLQGVGPASCAMMLLRVDSAPCVMAALWGE